VNNKVQKVWKWSWPNLMYYPTTCLQELRITIKGFCYKSGIRDRVLIRVFPILGDKWIGHVRQRKTTFQQEHNIQLGIQICASFRQCEPELSSSHSLYISSASAIAELLTRKSRAVSSSFRPLTLSRKHINQ
jgi:hypothetical protein